MSQFGCYQGYSKAVYVGYQRHSQYLTRTKGTRLAFDPLQPTKNDAGNFDIPVLDLPPTLELLRNPGHPSYVELPVIKNP